MKRSILDEIKESFFEENGFRNNRLRLPEDINFQSTGDAKTLIIEMKKERIVKNMQQDNSAFESWILAIKRWTHFENFVLLWEDPPNKKDHHYQRFLYRVLRFRECYDWFCVAEKCQDLLKDSRIRGGEKYLLNVPRSKSQEPNWEKLEKKPKCMSENELEWYILKKSRLRKELELKELHRQLPVGLFVESVSADNHVFTGKGSAIDLWGLDQEGNVLLFELKKFGNRPIGMISELFFYTMVIRDVTTGFFKFDDKPGTNDCDRGIPHVIIHADRIISFFLHKRKSLHPLIDKKLIEDMNAVSLGGPSVTFGDITFDNQMNFRCDRLMNVRIHRGTQEIGGSCVELWTDTTRVVVDIGAPLVNDDGTEFDPRRISERNSRELLDDSILPDITGFYEDSDVKSVDGVLISHPHLDHYGLGAFASKKIPFHLGEATHKLIDMTRMFTRKGMDIWEARYFDHRKPFPIGDLVITPYLNDHSGFDAYGFLIEGDGRRIYYTGDFRAHGRKEGIFHQFVRNPPANVDYLLMEGTNIGNPEKTCRKESELEDELISIIKKSNKLTLFQTSSQNIDRIVTFFRACRRSTKTLVLDLYSATVLKSLSDLTDSLPRASTTFPDLKVFFTFSQARILAKNDEQKLLYYFNRYRIRKEDIEKAPGKYVMITRPSLRSILDRFENIDGGDYIFSLWEGYLEKEENLAFRDYLTKRGFRFHSVHTSGHADLKTLKEFVSAVNPKCLIPIHTFHPEEYEKHFSVPVRRLNDGEILSC